MAGIRIPIGGDLGPLRASIAQIRGHMRRLSTQVAASLRPLRAVAVSVFRGMATAAKAAVRSIASAFAGLKRAIGLGGLLGAAGGGLLAAGALKSGSELAGDFERTSIALEALTGSGAEATRILDAMKESWRATGVEVSAQARTIQKFIALGFSPDSALQLQKNLLDIAGAVGMTAEETESLGSALSQVQAKGVVSMEELRQQIAEKGIPVFEALANRLGVTQAALMKLVEDGKVPAAELLAIFQNMEGSFSRFRGGAARMGATFSGMLARFRASWQMLLADFAAPINSALKPLLAEGMAVFGRLRQQAAAMGQEIGKAMLSAFALVKSGRTVELLATGLRIGMLAATDVLMRGLRAGVAFLATALPPVMEAVTRTLKDPSFWQGVYNLFRGLGMEIAATIREALPGNANKEAAELLRNSSGTAMDIGSRQIAGSGGKADMAKVLAESLIGATAAAATAAKGPMSEELRRALVDWKFLAGKVAADVKKLQRDANAVPAVPALPAAAGAVPVAAAPVMGKLEMLASSMARIGGGGFGMTLTPMVAEQKKGNGLLQKIHQTLKSAGPAVATYG